MEGFDSEISRQDKIKHRQMGEKHLLKMSHFYGESVQKSWSSLNTLLAEVFYLAASFS